MAKELNEKGSDRIYDELYGNVKEVAVINYDNAKWENNSLVKGDSSYKYVTIYDENGYVQETASYQFSQKTLKLKEKSMITKKDDKSRWTERISFYIISEPDTVFTRHTVTYDDASKLATIIISISMDNKNYTDTEKEVVSLRADGRMEYNYEDNSDYYAKYILKSTNASENLTTKEERIYQNDPQGNYTSQYYKTTNSAGTINIWGCVDRTIIYY